MLPAAVNFNTTRPSVGLQIGFRMHSVEMSHAPGKLVEEDASGSLNRPRLRVQPRLRPVKYSY